MSRTLFAVSRSARPLALAGVAVLFLAGGAWAQAPATGDGQKTVGATKVFRYLDKFLEVPAQDRSKLKVHFYLRENGKAAARYHPVLVDGDQRTPLPLGKDGHFERLPTLEQLHRKPQVMIDAPPEAKLANEIRIEAAVPLAQEMDAAEVKSAIRQVGLVTKDTVGALAILLPAVKATFVGAGSGTAISASGEATPLPASSKGPTYDPGVQKGAVKLRFARTPAYVDLTPDR